MTVRPRRSALFMPGLDAKAHEKARTLPADALVFDLEDAVVPDMKDAARRQMVASIGQGGFGPRELIVRVNPRDTPWGLEDVAAAVTAGVDAILVPKAERPGDIMRAAKDLRDAGAPEHIRLWAMIETPMAIVNLDSLLRTAADPSSRLDVVVMGTEDLAASTRARLRPGRAGLAAFLSLSVAAARAHGVEILDGRYHGYPGHDAKGFLAECEQGRDFGMDGKSLTHAAQIAICNTVFAPPRDEIALAEKIVLAFAAPANADRNVVTVDGHVVERLHEAMARRTIEIAEAIAART